MSQSPAAQTQVMQSRSRICRSPPDRSDGFRNP